MMKPKLLWAILILTLGGVVIVFVLNQHPKSPLPFYGRVADFTLTDRSGQPISLKDLKGEIWIADFIFTHCAGQCPMMSRQMSQLQKKLPPTIPLVSFTVDPTRDTPEILSGYAKTYHAQEGHWFFLTGDKETLNRLTTSFYMNTLEDPNMHSLRFVLVDGKAQIRGYYDGTDESAIQKLMNDAKRLSRNEE